MKQLTILLAILFFVSNGADAQDKTNEITNTKMENSIDSVSYGLGLLISKNLKSQGIDSLDYEKFIEAMKTVMTGGNPIMTEQDAKNFIMEYTQREAKAKAQKNLEEGKNFLAENGKRKGVITTASGLQYEVITQGKGDKPKSLTTNVTAHYHGTLINGTVFDSSVNRGQPFVTNVGQVIKAWQEALMLMNVGTKLRIYCPSELAYGANGAGGSIGPNMVLIFEMELISINN